ncbi:MAG: NADPH-dependent FMN reductase [Akkermansiaceae bacterium]
MKKILSIGASSSSTSINQQLADYSAHLIPEASVTRFPLHSLNIAMYSKDEEKARGIPWDAQRFIDAIQQCDGIVISMAEHNGSYTAAFKNLYDWASRQDLNVWQNRPMLLLSTSPGARGGATVIAAAENTFPRMGAEVIASFSLPHFYDFFSAEGIKDAERASQLASDIELFTQTL